LAVPVPRHFVVGEYPVVVHSGGKGNSVALWNGKVRQPNGHATVPDTVITTFAMTAEDVPDDFTHVSTK
jgi:hypothetical protein